MVIVLITHSRTVVLITSLVFGLNQIPGSYAVVMRCAPICSDRTSDEGFRESGVAGLTVLLCGNPGNHRLPESLKLCMLSLLHDHYSDFGATLAVEN